LRTFWEVRGHFVEGGRWLDRALAAEGELPLAVRAKALAVAGTVAFRQGLLEQAGEHFDGSLAIWRSTGDAEGIARGLSDLGTVAAAIGDFERATELLEESAAGFRELDEPKRLSIVLANLGHIAAQRGDYEAARLVTVEALSIQRELGHSPNEVISLYNLGSFAFEAGELAQARSWLDECVALTRALGYKEVMAYALAAAVRILLAEGTMPEAAHLAGVVDNLLIEVGVPLQASEQAKFDAAKAVALEGLGPSRFEAIHAEGLVASLPAALARAGIATT
jgi:tetratricopeptide (TPR) repeat protein